MDVWCTVQSFADNLVYCRYYGVNDPVARKMMERVDTLPKLTPPEDASITTLYIGGLTPVITEDDIRDQFYSYGELQSVKKVHTQMFLMSCIDHMYCFKHLLSCDIKQPREACVMFGVVVLCTTSLCSSQIVPQWILTFTFMLMLQIERKHCAFVTFTSRSAAETAAEALSNRLIIKGNRCRLLWGKPQEKRDEAAAAALNMLPSQVSLVELHPCCLQADFTVKLCVHPLACWK